MSTSVASRDTSEVGERRELLGPRAQLVTRSFLMLFLELALIRWSGSNVLYLSYFSNFVLLGSFLGIGLGFLRASRPRDLSPFLPVPLAVLVMVVWFAPLDVKIEGGGNLIFIGGNPNQSGLPREVVLPIIFLLVACTLTLVGEGVARVFSRFEPLEAYKLDLVGSVLGIVAFSVLAFLRTPPIGWGVVVAAVLVATLAPITDRRVAIGVAALLPVLAVLGWESSRPNTFWSPYYRITAEPQPGNATLVNVNRLPHQLQQPVSVSASPSGLRGGPGVYSYETIRPPDLDDVLIIGAGGGNDVAAALLKGAGHVDAVEIDPKLYELGRERHPNQPYSDPRVTVHIDDGRAFLERSQKRYDLVVLALPDSLTLVSGQSSLRLESYLFTKEALASARDHLTDDGVFVMYNYYREDWLADRFARTLEDVYGRAPCQMSLGTGAVRFSILAAGAPSSLDCAGGVGSDPGRPHQWQAVASEVASPATDDHPFPYLKTNTLPTFYLVTILLILLASVLLVRGVAGPLRSMVRYADLFFMGLAFLLLETKSIVQFALLFGTTWLVNALVFLGVLLSVLAAVAVSKRVRLRRPALLYIALLASLVVAWLVPLRLLLDLDVVPRFLAAVLLAFFPIFTANLVFTERFRDTASSTTAFGANLLGAMVGGLVEYSALVVGYRNLLVLAALVYLLAFLTGRRHLAPATA